MAVGPRVIPDTLSDSRLAIYVDLLRFENRAAMKANGDDGGAPPAR